MKARLGQNFLYQPAWQERAVAAMDLVPGDAVVEIGGGPGDITALLAARAQRLLVVEIDPRLAAGLRQRFADQPHVTVLEADVLEVNLGLAIHALGVEQARVFGNLPYYITSPILMRLLRRADVVKDATIMVQLEVADRLLTPPGGSEFGLLSATAQFYSRPRRLFDLPPGAFRPPPQVRSSLLRLDMQPQSEILGVDAVSFEAFLKLAFARKRKLLSNNLRLGYPAAAVEKALRQAQVPTLARAEQLGLDALAQVLLALPQLERDTHPGGDSPRGSYLD